jgi:glucose/arabinose dehydrogenase
MPNGSKRRAFNWYQLAPLRSGRAALIFLGSLLLLAGCDEDRGNPDPGPAPSVPVELGVEPVLTMLDQPLGLEALADGRLFIVQKTGRVMILADGELLPEPFLDIRELISTEGERGLLGIAFHPDFAGNGELYAYYSAAANGSGTVARFTVDATDPDRVDPDSHTVLLTVERDPAITFHYGGQLEFGPDGYLYIALGDAQNRDNAQRLDTLLGKLLRIDTAGNGAGEYGIPPDNPFAGQAGARGEIWAYGLRNPWRFSFDRLTGDLWISDVGEDRWEEVNFQPADSSGGENYGWGIMEGGDCFGGDSCDRSGLTLPRIQYANTGENCSVTGGFVYRGQLIPELQGRYVLGDFCSGTVWTADAASSWQLGVAAETGLQLTSFGQDAAGELYVMGYLGELERLVSP